MSNGQKTAFFVVTSGSLAFESAEKPPCLVREVVLQSCRAARWINQERRPFQVNVCVAVLQTAGIRPRDLIESWANEGLRPAMIDELLATGMTQGLFSQFQSLGNIESIGASYWLSEICPKERNAPLELGMISVKGQNAGFWEQHVQSYQGHHDDATVLLWFPEINATAVAEIFKKSNHLLVRLGDNPQGDAEWAKWWKKLKRYRCFGKI